MTSSNAFLIGLATTAFSPTSTIGRWIRFGSVTIALITSASEVSSLSPAPAAPRVALMGRKPVFAIKAVRLSSVNGSLK